jgi:hypothetical protein
MKQTVILIFLSYVSCSVGKIVITDVWNRQGEKEGERVRDVRLKWKRGVTQGK